MTSQFPNSPKLLRGALVVYESHTPGSAAKVISFQYNPDQVSRSLSQGQGSEAGAGAASSRGQAQENVLRVAGPPDETITLSIQLDAADQLAEPDSHQMIVKDGLYPVLATLEMLLYPTSFQMQHNETLAAGGEVQLNPADLPLTLLVWGKSRVVPVKISSFSVTEEAFDTSLNPIRAKVELGLKVLTYVDLPADSAGRDIYIAFQEQKEQLAAKYGRSFQDRRIRQLLPQ